MNRTRHQKRFVRLLVPVTVLVSGACSHGAGHGGGGGGGGWGTPVAIASPYRVYGLPLLGTDSSGHALVTYETATSGVGTTHQEWQSFDPVAESWSPAQLVLSSGTLQAFSMSPDGRAAGVFFSPGASGVVTYATSTGWAAPIVFSTSSAISATGVAEDRPGHVIVQAYRSSTQAIEIYDLSDGIFSGPSVLTSTGNFARIASNGRGAAVAVWQDQNAMLARTLTNGLWSPAQVIASTATPPTITDLQISAAGDAVTAWYECASVCTSSVDNLIGGVWSPPTQLFSGSFAANVELALSDSFGIAVAAQGGLLWSRFDPGTGWSTPALALPDDPMDSGADVTDPLAIAANRSGRVLVAWQNSNVFASAFTGSGWTNRIALDSAVSNPQDYAPAIAAADDGEMFVAWDQVSTNNFLLEIDEYK